MFASSDVDIATLLRYPNVSSTNSSLNNESYRYFLDLLRHKYGVQGDDKDYIWEYLKIVIGPRRGPLETVVTITVVYCLLFFTGIVGNVCTCIVIAKNKYMHTATNYYLFNLAIADLLLLIIGLPTETYVIWQEYPWVFGEAFCIIRTLLAEMSTFASILTITAFTIERYVAICHPMKAQTMSSLKRVFRIIIGVWILAAVFSIPQTIQFRVIYAHDKNNKIIPESATCNVKESSHMGGTFEISFFLFFIVPMTFISVLYTLIAVAIRRSALTRAGSDASNKVRLTGGEIRAQQQTRARRSVLKMLVAVVVAFFCCWAPFHAQRLMTLYVPASEMTGALQDVYKIIFYISGVCYFISCTINPILYSIMSLKFRQAFKQTLLRKSCCHKPPRPKKRSYFSYKFAHRNGYSETSFTSVEPAPHAGVARGGNHSASDTDQRPHSSGSGTRQGSPAHSNGGGSVKNMEDQKRSSKRDSNSMLHIKCYDKNCNKADMFVGLCGRLEFSYGSSKPLCHSSGSTK